MVRNRTHRSGARSRSASAGWKSAFAAMLLGGCSSAATLQGQAPEVRPVTAINGQAVSDENGPHYAKGKAQFASAQLGLAVAEFRAALAEHPGSIDILNALGATYDRLGRFDLADDFYKEAVARDPKNTQTLNNLAYSLMLRGDPKRAIALLELAKTEIPTEKTIAGNLDLAKEMGQGAGAPNAPAETAGAQGQTADTDVSDKPRGPLSIERRSLVVQELVFNPDRPAPRSATGGGGSGPLPLVISLPPTPSAGDQKVATAPQPRVEQAALGTLEPVTAAVAAPAPVASPSATPGLPPAPQSDAAPAPSAPPVLTIAAAEEPQPIKLDASAQPSTDRPDPPPEHRNVAAVGDAPELVVVARTEVTPEEAARMIDVPSERAVSPSPQAQPRASACAVEVSNGAGRDGMAARFRNFVQQHGFTVRRLTNDKSFAHPKTVIFYRPGFEDRASAIAALTSAPVTLERADLDRCDVRVVLGRDLVAFDRTLVHPLAAMAEP